jgi:hypothetical protein
MFQIQHRVGRLVEVSAGGRLALDEMKRFRTEFAQLLARTQGLLVICVDWRQAERIEDDALPLLVGVMRSDNPRLERAAHLPSPSIEAQVTMLALASMFSQRRAFYRPEALLDWVDEVLSPEESGRLRAFLGMTP